MSANAPAAGSPAIVPTMKLACIRTQPLRMEKSATAMDISVHTVSPWIQLNWPALSSRIENEDSVTNAMAAIHIQPTTR